MVNKKNIWIKKEGTDEICTEPGPMIQVYPTSVNLKEDWEETANQEVVTSTRYAFNSRRLIQRRGDSCGISFQETINERVVHDELKIGTWESTNFTMFGTHTEGLTSQEANVLCTKLKYRSREKELQKFSCSFCLQSFPSKYKLIKHVFTHIDGVQPPIYICKLCGEVFPSNGSLNKHGKMGVCDQALLASINEKFDSSYNPKKTAFLDHDQELSMLEQTEKQSSSKDSGKTLKKTFNDVCNTLTISRNSKKRDKGESNSTLTAAIKVSTNTVGLTVKRPHKCDICGNCFTQLGSLKSHILIHTGKKPHKCDVCGKSFTQLGTLKSHVLIHTGKRPHKCDICGKSFTQLSTLKTHLLLHKGNRPHTCEICGKSFALLRGLKCHSLIHAGIKPHKCNICGNSFTQLGHLKEHVLIHIGIRPHKCHVCGKSYTQSNTLKKHALTHMGRRPYECDICGMSFTQSGNLKTHSLIHTGQRPHKCDICGKSFVQSGTLKSHRIIHTGKRPHKCGSCNKSFTDLRNLKRHELIHTGKRPHKCDICGKCFTQLGNLKRHVLLHTGKE
ncbi:zinc finger protein 99-like [Schistocerca piceifrons]|uniref:zinc finger protein 99-like n=1 Tax=Schistocerca piceifrons TaxID=274613 RepID=UPI001F5E454C|nr:zinc finger protein 99-like [Schistocerca piceifrons]